MKKIIIMLLVILFAGCSSSAAGSGDYPPTSGDQTGDDIDVDITIIFSNFRYHPDVAVLAILIDGDVVNRIICKDTVSADGDATFIQFLIRSRWRVTYPVSIGI